MTVDIEQRYLHYDAQDDRMVISTVKDIGVGPAVVFDAGAFTDAEALRAYAHDLLKAALWLARERSGHV